MKYSIIGAALAASLTLAGCGGSGNNNSPAAATGPRVVGDIPIANVSAGTNFAFDLGLVVNHSPAAGFYAFTDRNNKSVDRIDIATQKVTAQITGTVAAGTAFAGVVGGNSTSGPDGLNDVGVGIMYAGDVGSVKVINTLTNTITSVIKGGLFATSTVRADEGCVGTGAALGTYIISTPEAVPPFATVIDVATHSVIANITFTDLSAAPSAGLEQCRYDATTDNWFFNNDGTTANPHGEVDVLTGASVRGIAVGTIVNYTALTGVKMFPMTATPAPGCDPTGLALGPGTDIAVMCREATAGAPLLLQILDRTNGTIMASIKAGGGDQLEFDPTSNRYYGGNSRWTADGLAAAGDPAIANSAGTCTTLKPCTPVMSVIDAVTRTLVTMVPTGNNAHSVAVDPVTGLIFMPYSSATNPAGCATCTANGFINGGVHVLTTH